MAQFGLVVKVIYLFIITSEVHAVSVVEVLFSDLSERLDNLDRSFETRFDAIKDRLDRLEEVVGVNEHHSENHKRVGNVVEGISQYIDIRNAKHQFMKAMATEKQNLRRFVRDYEQRFDDFKHNVNDILSEVNDSITESNENLVSNMVQHTNSVNEQLSDISLNINTVDNNATIERNGIVSKLQIMEDRIMNIEMNQRKHVSETRALGNRVSSVDTLQEDKIKRLGSRITSLNSHHVSDIRALGNQVNDFNSSIYGRISSLSERISTLHERKVGFTAVLSASKMYKVGSTIEFDNDFYNPDGAYDSSTGIFTAPKSGTYLFSISVERAASIYAYAMFMNSGVKQMSAYSEKSVDVTSSNTCVTYMYEGKKAWVEAFGDCEFYHDRTSFSGVLLD